MSVLGATAAGTAIVLAISLAVVLFSVPMLARFLDKDIPQVNRPATPPDVLIGEGRDVHSVGARAFTICGKMTGRLSPAVTRRLKLSLHNQIPFDISVTKLTVRVRGVHAPRADAGQPCTVADFAVRRLTDPRPIAVPARRTTELTAVNVRHGRWPRIHMRNMSTNQDGYKGATVRLAYSGVAVRTAS